MQSRYQIPLAALGAGAAFTVIFGVANPMEAYAEVRIYTGVGTCTIGDLGTPAQAKNLAHAKALQNAREQAGVYITNYTHTINTQLAANEISAITNIILKEGEVTYQQVPGEFNGQPVIAYTASLQARIDTDGVKNWLYGDEKKKNIIIQQNETVQRDINNSINEKERLAQQYNGAGSQQEKEAIRREYNEADKKLLAGQKLDEALALYYKGDYDGAIRVNNEALALNPESDVAYNNRGNAYVAKGEYDRSIADFTQTLAINPKCVEAYNNRGVVYTYKGEYDRAITDFNQALSIDPKSVEAYNNRGNTYNYKDEYDRAITDYTQALAINPKCVEAYNNRGNAYKGKGEYDRAIADYTQALSINPKCANAYNGRGNAYKGKGEYDRAIADYTQALAINPKYAYAYNGRGNAYKGKGEYDRAIADYTQALAINPKYAKAYNNRGLAYNHKGEYDRAIADWQQYLIFNPGDEDIIKNIQAAEKAKHSK